MKLCDEQRKENQCPTCIKYESLSHNHGLLPNPIHAKKKKQYKNSYLKPISSLYKKNAGDVVH